MDGPCECWHEQIDKIVEVHEAMDFNICWGSRGLCHRVGDPDCCCLCGCNFNAPYFCACDELCRETEGPYKCAYAFVCGTLSLSIRTAIGLPIYVACVALSCIGYCLTNQCCEYENKTKRIAAWLRKNPGKDYRQSVTQLHMCPDTATIVADYVGPEKQQVD